MNWDELYKGLQARANAPNVSITDIKATRAVFQAMYLDLAEIKLALLNSDLSPPLVTVVADVLNVPADCRWSLNGSVLQIQARRLQTTGDFRVSLDCRSSTTTSLVLYCAELAGRVQAVVVYRGGDPAVFWIDRPVLTGGTRVALIDGVPVKRELTWAQGIPLELPTWFEQSRRTAFIFASLLYQMYPEVAISQYTWLKNWTGYNSEVLGIFLQSSSLLALLSAQVRANDNGTVFVPYLSHNVYGDLAQRYVAEATQYESDYRTLKTQEVVDDQFITLAKALLANKTYESTYNDELLAQAKRNFDNALAATDAAQKRLADAKLAAELISIDFQQIGVPAWKRAQIAKAVIEIGTAVVGFAVGIGTIFLGNPAGGAAAVDGAVAGAEAAEEAAEAGSEIATLAKQLTEVMGKLHKVGMALDKIVNLAKVIIQIVGNIEQAGDLSAKMREMSTDLDGADLTATYEWQVYQQASDAALKGPVDLGIEFAEQLKVAVDTVAIYGQALAAAQAATIDAGQRYATISLKTQMAKQQQAELQRYVDDLVHGKAAPAALMQRFYELYLDAKSGLFAAIQGYRASYYYWALVPSSINPAIVDGVDRLATGLQDLTSIALDYQNALDHFNPPPQMMTDKQFVINDPQILSALARHGQARWALPPAAPTFAGYDRVRLSRVRVWLDGATVRDGTSVKIVMSTLGNYLDRFAIKSFQFTAKPLVRDFEYRVSAKKVGSPDWRFPDGSYGYIELDGAVDDEVRYAYFQPTPFAEWHISVSGEGLNLSTITRLVMQFRGSAIPQV